MDNFGKALYNIKAYTNIRQKQLFRNLKEIGLFRLLVLLMLLLFAVLSLLRIEENPENTVFTSFGYFSAIAYLHFTRGDIRFLKIHFLRHWPICLAEYVFLSLPLLIIHTYYNYFIENILFVLGLFLLSFLSINLKQHATNNYILRFVPQQYYEWRSVLRKGNILLVLVLTASIFTSFWVGSIPIAILIFGLVPLGMVENHEPLDILIAPELSPKQFLYSKLKTQITVYSAIVVPLIMLFMVFHYELWYIPVIEYFLFVSLHVYMVLLKYAHYEPNTKSSASQIFASIGLLGVFVPFLTPLIWIMSIHFYFKSKNNLNFYLHDFA